MKKIRIRFFSLCMALILIAPLLARPARAAEVEPYEGTPLFVVLMLDPDDEPTYVLNAFLVHDPETGGTYLLGSQLIYNLVREDYTACILGDDDYFNVAEAVAKGGSVSYLYTTGLESAPYLVLSDSSSKKAAAVYREMSSDGVEDPVQINYDLSSGWSGGSGSFLTYSGHKIDTTYLLGAPMISTEDSSVLGSITMNDDGEIVLARIQQGKLSTDYSIETLSSRNSSGGSSETDKPEPDTGSTEAAPASDGGSSDGGSSGSGTKNGEEVSDSDSKSTFPWVAVLAVAAVLGYLVYRSNTKKKNVSPKEGTVSLDSNPFSPYGNSGPMSMDHVGDTAPVQDAYKPGYGPTTPVSQWQLRCLGGGMDGRVFPVSGTVRIGRNPQCEIAFPENTPGVSGNHCEVSLEGDRVVLRDLNATYGTYLGANTRLEAHRSYDLHMGDTFTLAQNGPSLRLEKIGASMEEYGPAVRDLAGRTYRADASGRLTFGRGSGNQVRLPADDQSVSGSHCVLYREAGKLYLMDLDSTNGTFFSQSERLKPNTPYRIRKGMAFFLSNSKHTFVVTEE